VRPTDYTTVLLPQGELSSSFGAVLETERWTSSAFGNMRYSIEVPSSGTYVVQLLFAEMWHPRTGVRVFHVDIGNTRVLPFFDIFAEVGFQNPLLKEFMVEVDSGSVVVDLTPLNTSPEGPAIYSIALRTAPPPSEVPTVAPTLSPTAFPTAFPTTSPTLSAFVSPTAPTSPSAAPSREPTLLPTTAVPSHSPTPFPTGHPTSQPTTEPSTVVPTEAPTHFVPLNVHRINCGGPTVTDTVGYTWVTDADLAPGGLTVRPSLYTPVFLAPNDLSLTLGAVLETERWSSQVVGNVVYQLPVPSSGTYQVELLFSEMWHPSAGARKFHVDIQGQRVFSDVDVFAEAGFQTPIVKTAAVNVVDTDASIVVELVPSANSPEGPAVYSIAVSTAQSSSPTAAPYFGPTMPTFAPIAPPTITTGTVLIESRCLAVCETEGIPYSATEGWILESSAAGYSGAGYLQWQGENHFAATDAGRHGLLTYPVHLSRRGNYRIAIRNYHDDPDPTESNDCWLKVGAYEWVKVYSEHVGIWQWMSKMDLGHGDTERPPVYFLEAGHHVLQIAGRSHGFAIDRVHVYDESCADPRDVLNPFLEPATLAPIAPTTAAPTTSAPTSTPTSIPSAIPTAQPTSQPTSTRPTSQTPSNAPTFQPTQEVVMTAQPTHQPTTNWPTFQPSSAAPTLQPTQAPTPTPSVEERSLRFADEGSPSLVGADVHEVSAAVEVTNTGSSPIYLKMSFKRGPVILGGATQTVLPHSHNALHEPRVVLNQPLVSGETYRALMYLTIDGSWGGRIGFVVRDVVAVDDTFTPTFAPSRGPTQSPTSRPSLSPTYSPSALPTDVPSGTPTLHPHLSPTTDQVLFTPTVIHRINCGGPTVVDALGNTWIGDGPRFPGGSTVTPSAHTDVALADEPSTHQYGVVLETERWTRNGLGSIAYNLDIASPGVYRVTLVLIEVWHQAVGTRVFNVKAQGRIVLVNLDVVREAGFQTPLVIDLLVDVTAAEGSVQLEFVPLAQSDEGPAIYAIAVETTAPPSSIPTSVPTAPTAAPTDPPMTIPPTVAPTTLAPTTPAPTYPPTDLNFHWFPVTRVNLGAEPGTGSVLDALGNTWETEDAYYVSGDAQGSSESSTLVTFNVNMRVFQVLYSRERWADALEYVVPVPVGGRYQVTLFLAENWHRTPGSRLFSLMLQGRVAKERIDVVNSSGWQTASTVSAETLVSEADGGLLRIQLFRDPGSDHNVAVFAFEVALAAVEDDVTRLNSGGPTVDDVDGKSWQSDTGLSPGGATVIPSLYTGIGGIPPLAAAAFGNLMHTERWTRSSLGDIVYYLPAPYAGFYVVRILTVEMWHQAEESRAFSILVQGETVYAHVDPLDEVGFQKPLWKDALVELSQAGTIEVRMRATFRAEGPSIMAVALVPLHPVGPGIPLPLSYYGDPWQDSGYVDPDGLTPVCLDARPIVANAMDVPYEITWRPGASHPVDFREAQGIAYGGRLWVIGGFESDANLPDLGDDGFPIRWVRQGRRTMSYDPETDTWERHTDIDIPGGLTHAGQAIFEDKIVLAGGLLMGDGAQWPNASSIDTVLTYDVAADTWGHLPSLPARRGAGALVALGRRLHFFGGGRFEPFEYFVQDYSSHWYLDMDETELQWRSLAPLRNARNHLGGGVHSGKIYAVGGQHLELEYTANQDAVEMYDPCTNRWVFVAPMPEPRGHITNSMSAFREGIIVVGGVINGDLYEDTRSDPRKADSVLFYNPTLDSWTRLNAKDYGGASQATGIVVSPDGSTKIVSQRWNGSWIGRITWEEEYRRAQAAAAAEAAARNMEWR